GRGQGVGVWYWCWRPWLVGVGVPLALRVDPGASLHQRLESAKTLLRETPLFDGFNFTAELKKLVRGPGPLGPILTCPD
ncbi:putative dipeptidase, partial [Homarus americanus]